MTPISVQPNVWKPKSSSPVADQELADLLATRRPGFSLPQPFYTDERIFLTDVERIIKRFWLFAGHACRIPREGDYFTWQVGGEPIVIIRGRDGRVYGHYNVCRHRGSLVCVADQGTARKLVCPYHQWVYDRDGKLLATRHFPSDFDRSAYGLKPVHVRVLGGLIFICLADQPPEFEPFARDAEPLVRPYEMERTKICAVRRYSLRANWKLITENFRECYHCGGGHPEYCKIVLGAGTDHPVYSKDKHADVWRDREAHWQSLGLCTGVVPFTEKTWHHCARYPFRPGYVSETLDGEPCAPLLGKLAHRDAGVFAMVTYPNFWHECSGDYYVTIRITPVGATRSDAEMCWYVRDDAEEGRDFDSERVSAFWRATGEQDWQFAENNQIGVLSSAYQPGPYGPQEVEVEKFILWYLSQMRLGEGTV